MKTEKNRKNNISLKIKTSKAIRSCLNSHQLSFIERLKSINDIIFDYKLQTYGHAPVHS